MEFVSEVCKIVTAALQELSANEAELADLERKYTPPKSPYFIENIDRTAEFTAYKKHETALLEERQKVQESAERAIPLRRLTRSTDFPVQRTKATK